MYRIKVEYGNSFFDLEVPFQVDIAGMRKNPSTMEASDAYEKAFKMPVSGPSLVEIAQKNKIINARAKAIIVVSDNTRPVPYCGVNGLMNSLLQILLGAGFMQDEITILIGGGSHREMKSDEIETMLGLKASGLMQVHVINHRFDVEEELKFLGETARATSIFINKHYLASDLKIVTGLVESHFMAGASGGPKGICPGIVGKKTLEIFHGPFLLQSDHACDLQLEGNPLQEEAKAVAHKAGCDFLVNVTLDGDKNLTGVFCGELLSTHRAAVEFIKTYVTTPLEKRYDIVLLPAGFVGINHYQAAKAAVTAARVVEKGGIIIIVAKNTDFDPVGGEGYKTALKVMKENGYADFEKKITTPGWQFMHEQWQVQMWGKAFSKVGFEDHIIYCSTDIPKEKYLDIPGLAAINLLPETETPTIWQITRKALSFAINKLQKMGVAKPSIVYLKDGPYSVPIIEEDSALLRE